MCVGGGLQRRYYTSRRGHKYELRACLTFFAKKYSNGRQSGRIPLHVLFLLIPELTKGFLASLSLPYINGRIPTPDALPIFIPNRPSFLNQ